MLLKGHVHPNNPYQCLATEVALTGYFLLQRHVTVAGAPHMLACRDVTFGLHFTGSRTVCQQ